MQMTYVLRQYVFNIFLKYAACQRNITQHFKTTDILFKKKGNSIEKKGNSIEKIEILFKKIRTIYWKKEREIISTENICALFERKGKVRFDFTISH